jgi:hypothetical protein
MWNGSELKPLGTTRLIIKIQKTEKKYSIEFVVVPDNLTPLIGARAAQRMGLITVHEDHFILVAPPKRETKPKVRTIEATDELMNRHADVFSKELGTLPGTIHLQIDESAKQDDCASATSPHGTEREIQRGAGPPGELGGISKSL